MPRSYHGALALEQQRLFEVVKGFPEDAAVTVRSAEEGNTGVN